MTASLMAEANMRRRVFPVVSEILWASAGLGNPVVSYEGDTLPENDGWTNLTRPENLDPDPRSIQNGVFTIDAPPNHVDTIFYRRNIFLPGNALSFEWSSRISGVGGGSSLSVILEGVETYSEVLVSWQDDFAYLHLHPDTLADDYEYLYFLIAPDPFHIFRIDWTGSTVTAFVDGIPYLSTVMQEPAGLIARTQFGFVHALGDLPATSEWDYIRVSAIPEPASLALLLASGSFLITRRGRHGPCALDSACNGAA